GPDGGSRVAVECVFDFSSASNSSVGVAGSGGSGWLGGGFGDWTKRGFAAVRCCTASALGLAGCAATATGNFLRREHLVLVCGYAVVGANYAVERARERGWVSRADYLRFAWNLYAVGDGDLCFADCSGAGAVGAARGRVEFVAKLSAGAAYGEAD